MATPMHAILTAHRGRQKMLQAIFGGGGPEPPPTKTKPVLSLVRSLAELKKNYDKQKGG